MPWTCLLWLAAPAVLAALLVAGYVRPGSPQVNQFPPPTPSRWYAVPLQGRIQIYHFGAAVPESAAPDFVRMNLNGGTWGRGSLVLGETRVSPFAGGSVTAGYVHQGGGSRLATPFSQWSLGLWKPFFLSWLLFLPAAVAFRRHRARLRRGAGLCMRCGYDLTGNLSGVCPECGAAAAGAAA